VLQPTKLGKTFYANFLRTNLSVEIIAKINAKKWRFYSKDIL
jgi:hypothetical protein